MTTPDPEVIRELAAELASLKRQLGDIKGSLVFLGHDPDEIDRLGGVPA